MRRISLFLLSFVVLGTINVCAQDGNPAVPDWENPHVFGINKEPGARLIHAISGRVSGDERGQRFESGRVAQWDCGSSTG